MCVSVCVCELVLGRSPGSISLSRLCLWSFMWNQRGVESNHRCMASLSSIKERMGPERGRSGAGAGPEWEPERGRSGAGAGQERGRSGAGAGQERGRSGAGAGQERGRSGAREGPEWGRSGAGVGQEWGRSGTGAGPERGHSGAGAGPERGRSGAGAGPERGRSGATAGPSCLPAGPHSSHGNSGAPADSTGGIPHRHVVETLEALEI